MLMVSHVRNSFFFLIAELIIIRAVESRRAKVKIIKIILSLTGPFNWKLNILIILKV